MRDGMRVGLLADAHGNLEAFDEGRRALDRVGVDELCFLGDAVGYLPGGGVAAAVVASGMPAVRGNHEAMLLGRTELRADDGIVRLTETAATLDDAVRDAVAAWPERQVLALDGASALLVHGSVTDPTWGYVHPDTDLDDEAAALDGQATVVFMGNTHRPFVRRCGDRTFVNVGSCGLPRDVGDLGAAGVFDTATGTARIIRFAIGDATAAALARCGDVHPVVHEVLARRTEEYVGELV